MVDHHCRIENACGDCADTFCMRISIPLTVGRGLSRVKERLRVDASPLEEVAFLVLGDTVLELLRVKVASPPSLDSWHAGYKMMALEVDDMDKAAEYLASKGVGIT